MCMSGGRDWEESGSPTSPPTTPRVLSGNVYSKIKNLIQYSILVYRVFLFDKRFAVFDMSALNKK